MKSRALRFNPVVKGVQIILDRQRNMVFDANAYSAYEEATGKFFLDTLSQLQEMSGKFLADQSDEQRARIVMRGLSVRDIRALVWAACLHEDPDLTLDEVGSYLVTIGHIMGAFTAVFRGVNANEPGPEELPETAAVVTEGGEPRPILVTPLAENGGVGSGA